MVGAGVEVSPAVIDEFAKEARIRTAFRSRSRSSWGCSVCWWRQWQPAPISHGHGHGLARAAGVGAVLFAVLVIGLGQVALAALAGASWVHEEAIFGVAGLLAVVAATVTLRKEAGKGDVASLAEGRSRP